MHKQIKNVKKVLMLVLFALASTAFTNAFAQSKGVSGTVVDVAGAPIPGVTVMVQGTSNVTTTDNNGAFSLRNVNNDNILVFQFIGMKTVEAPVGTQGTFMITMEEEAFGLNELVVTALGIKRERKALGYAMQEVKGSEILNSRESNVVNSLSGKVSGLQVIRSSNGPAGSSKIILRGNNSLTGSNQPLIVVDGVPMDNFTGSSNNDYWNPAPDMGNGMSDINPEDIESMSVLKGASAAALYGSRAGNGVILITTKAGSKQKGLGLSISGTVGMETVFMSPAYQNDFGQGTEGTFNNRSQLSWGPQITGQSIDNWDGKSVKMAAYDNVRNYFDKPGVNITETVTFQQAYEKVSVYTSMTRTDDKSIIPGAKLGRTNLTTRAVSHFGKDDRWTLDAKVQYIRTFAKNRPLNGNNTSNSFMTMYLMPRSMDITGFSAGVDELGKMLWYGGGQQMNPYWMSENNIATDQRDRFLMTASLKYQFTSWLDAEIKGGTDMYTTDNESKTWAGSPLTSTGRYSFGKSSFNETNYSALITARKDDVLGKLGGAIQLGGNLMSTYSNGVSGSAGELLVPNLFAINNALNGKPSVSESFSQKKINSVYGILQLNWDGWLFLDGTFRNDWTSTLSAANRSFFYPSVSGSWVITDMMEKLGGGKSSWLSFAKIRASFAQVGNDLSPYQLYNDFSLGSDPTGAPTASAGNTLYDANVRNELISSAEVGAEIRFFNNRLGLDVAWYKSNATNQLINLPMDPTSGYSSRKINAGDIQNQGMEFMFNARIFDSPNPKGFIWDLTANYSFNRNKIVKLASDLGVTQYGLGGYDDIQILAAEGSLYGDIYGTTYQRVQEGQYKGQLLLSAAGLPQRNTDKSFLGNQQATGLLGVTNSFSWNNFNFSFLIDARFGGYMFSGTNQLMQLQGTSNVTVVDGKRENMVLAGVISDGQGGYTPNTASITTQQYWESVAGQGNVGIVEANMCDATNVRLRNVQLNYTIRPNNSFFQSIRLGVTCTNVWMIYSKMNGVDPESVYATGTNAVGFESGASPTTRNFLFNVTLNF